jgi:hypothetical protein
MKNLATFTLALGALTIAACNTTRNRVKESALLKSGGEELVNYTVGGEESVNYTTHQPENVLSMRNFHGETLIIVGKRSFRQMGTTYFLADPRTDRSVDSLPSFNGGISDALSPTGLRSIYGEPNDISADGRIWKYWISGFPKPES